MRIQKIRFGFATNSSSTHSIVILNKGEWARDDYDKIGEDFGWDFFTLGTTEAKLEYLASVLSDNLRSIPEEERLVVINHMLGTDFTGVRGIDHQSFMALPTERVGWGSERFIDKEFLKDFRKFVERDDVAILGGNDNADHAHPLATVSREAKLWLTNGKIEARKSGNFWVLFDRESGLKTRVTFDDIEIPRSYKSAFPELVDLKVTDYCPFNCPMCYQGSTKKGKHADITTIEHVLRSLSDIGVFEVAIGGGEPTLHPNFERIISFANDLGLVPNFTTKNLDYLASMKREVLAAVGGIAVSVKDGSDVEKLNSLDNYDLLRKVSLQAVVGYSDLASIAEQGWRFRLTLLGYKEAGRGLMYSDSVRKEDLRSWPEVVLKEFAGRVSIDTQLAKQSKELGLLDKYNVSELMYETEEGKTSMYVDAVTMKAAPSSYCASSEFIELPDSYNKTGLDRALIDAFYSF